MLIWYVEHFLIILIYEVIKESAYISISNDTNNKIKVLKLHFEANTRVQWKICVIHYKKNL